MSNCKFCNLYLKVFGIENCSQISNEISNEALDMMYIKTAKYLKEVREKFNNKEINLLEYQETESHVACSLIEAAVNIVTSLTIEGPCISAEEILILIKDKLNQLNSVNDVEKRILN